ncbi:heavy metal-associated domain, HMA [Artemisia annua]|uniref:Heavy metal-associated domain, HMA n=1 Tax=Artemisia annua TaxID=35608 RepID=A0A2U1MYA0_ARTAN|nr:heavy metal-associated domain, HMA [Artemisia annua]
MKLQKNVLIVDVSMQFVSLDLTSVKKIHYSETLFTIKIHHGGYFTIPPNRRYRFGDIDYVDLIDCHFFSIQRFVSMLDELGLGVDTKMYTHFRILRESLDDGLVPLMSEEDMVTLLKYVPRFKETEVYTKNAASKSFVDDVIIHDSKEIYLSKLSYEELEDLMRSMCGKGVVIEEIEDEDKDDVFNEAEKDGKDVVMEDVKHGDMFLSEWHGATEMGKVDKEGKQVEHSTNHASSSKVDCCNEENEFFPDFDDEIVIPTLWSAEVRTKKRAQRLSDEYEFRKMLLEIDHIVDDNYEKMKEKLSQEEKNLVMMTMNKLGMNLSLRSRILSMIPRMILVSVVWRVIVRPRLADVAPILDDEAPSVAESLERVNHEAGEESFVDDVIIHDSKEIYLSKLSYEELEDLMRSMCGKGVVIEEIEDEDKDDVFNEAEKDGKDVVMEDVKHGDMFLSEWHGATEMGKVDKEGKQVEHSTNHASSSKVDCCNEENEFFPDFDDEIVIPTLWSAEVRTKKGHKEKLSHDDNEQVRNEPEFEEPHFIYDTEDDLSISVIVRPRLADVAPILDDEAPSVAESLERVNHEAGEESFVDDVIIHDSKEICLSKLSYEELEDLIVALESEGPSQVGCEDFGSSNFWSPTFIKLLFISNACPNNHCGASKHTQMSIQAPSDEAFDQLSFWGALRILFAFGLTFDFTKSNVVFNIDQITTAKRIQTPSNGHKYASFQLPGGWRRDKVTGRLPLTNNYNKIQTCHLQVNISCKGCKKEVKQKLQKIEGVYTVNIDQEHSKVTVSGAVTTDILIKKLAKSCKVAEVWGGNGNGGQKGGGGGGGLTPQQIQQTQEMRQTKRIKNLKMHPQFIGGGGGKKGVKVVEEDEKERWNRGTNDRNEWWWGQHGAHGKHAYGCWSNGSHAKAIKI